MIIKNKKKIINELNKISLEEKNHKNKFECFYMGCKNKVIGKFNVSIYDLHIDKRYYITDKAYMCKKHYLENKIK